MEREACVCDHGSERSNFFRPYIMGSELRCQNFDLVKIREIIPRNPCLKKNQNTPRPSEHPPVMGKKCQNV